MEFINPNNNGIQQTQWFGNSNNPSTQSIMQNSVVIPPPPNEEKKETKRDEFLIVDSRDRNHTDYPEPNQYAIDLPTDIKDIEKIQLVSYKIPTPQYTIRNTNNILYYTNTQASITNDGAGNFTVDEYSFSSKLGLNISNGYYEDTITNYDTTTGTAPALLAQQINTDFNKTIQQDQLAKQIENQLNSDVGNTTYVVHIESLTKKYTFFTDFSNPANMPYGGGSTQNELYETPKYFQLFFQGCNQFYGSTSTMIVDNKETKVGKQQYTYLENSIGPVLGFQRKDFNNQLTGTIQTSGTSLQGTGTKFLTELKKGDWIFAIQLSDNKSYRFKIEADPTSDTLATIGNGVATNATVPPNITDAFAWRGRIEAPWIRNLNLDCYIVMDIQRLPTLQSLNTTINKSFFIIPDNKDAFTETRERGKLLPFKKFEPVLSKLDKLYITYYNPDGSLYDFMGNNHVLTFKLVKFKSNINYGSF